MSEISEPPKFPLGLYVPKKPKSEKKLDEMKYDPLERQVRLIMRLEKELDRQEMIRSGELIELTPTGKRRYYNEMNHLSIYDKLAKANNDLIKYKYGKVPDNIEENNKQVHTLTIGLSEEGAVFEIGGEEDNEEYIEYTESTAKILDSTTGVKLDKSEAEIYGADA